MSFIRIRKALPADPRLASIAEQVGLSRDEALGVLVRLWAWAEDHAPRGVAPITPAQLDTLVGHAGFAEALVKVGWLEARLHEVALLNRCDYSRSPRRGVLKKMDAEAAGARAAQVIPPRLDTPGFRAAWQEWVDHRKAKGAPLTPQAANRQLQALNVWGLKRAILAIQHSICRNWQGIYEEVVGRKSKSEEAAQKTKHDDDIAATVKQQAQAATQQREEEERLRREQESEPAGSLLFGSVANAEPQWGEAP